MRRYILNAPLTPPKGTSDAAERLIRLAKTCREMIADGIVTAEEAGALRRWLQAAGCLKNSGEQTRSLRASPENNLKYDRVACFNAVDHAFLRGSHRRTVQQASSDD